MLHTIQKQTTSITVTRDALKQCQGVADAIGRSRSQLRRIQQRINRDDLLQERRHDAYRCAQLAFCIPQSCSKDPSIAPESQWALAIASNLRPLTERMPQYQRKLWDLFALLAQL